MLVCMYSAQSCSTNFKELRIAELKAVKRPCALQARTAG